MTNGTKTPLRDLAAAAWRKERNDEIERTRRKYAEMADEFRRAACRVLKSTIGVDLSVDDVAVETDPDGLPIKVSLEVEGVAFGVHYDVSELGRRYHLRLRVPCANGCTRLVPGTRIESLSDLGRCLAEPEESTGLCDICASQAIGDEEAIEP